MKPPRTPGGLGLVVLDEARRNARGREITLVVGLEEITPRVAEYLGFNNIKARDGRFMRFDRHND